MAPHIPLARTQVTVIPISTVCWELWSLTRWGAGKCSPYQQGCWELQSSCELGWRVCGHGLSEHLGWGSRGGPEALPHEAQVRELSTLILEKETQVCLHPCSWKSETNGLCT